MTARKTFDVPIEVAKRMDQLVGSELNICFKRFIRRHEALYRARDVDVADLRSAILDTALMLPEPYSTAFLTMEPKELISWSNVGELLWRVTVLRGDGEGQLPAESIAELVHNPSYQNLVRYLYDAILWNMVIAERTPDAKTLRGNYKNACARFYSEMHTTTQLVGDASAKQKLIDDLVMEAMQDFVSLTGIKDALEQTPQEVLEKIAAGLPEGIRDEASMAEIVQSALHQLEELDEQLRRIKAEMKKSAKQRTPLPRPTVNPAKWQMLVDSPEHALELSWLFSMIPSEERDAVTREIALAISRKRRLPDVDRFHDILLAIMRKQKRLIC